VLPRPDGLALQVAVLGLGVVLNGLAGALYIGAQLGPGPRDGLMTGLARRTGRSLRLVRTGIEVTVLAAGFLLGGVVGLGTVLYALALGPLVQLMLPWVVVRLGTTDASASEPAATAVAPRGVRLASRAPAAHTGTAGLGRRPGARRALALRGQYHASGAGGLRASTGATAVPG